MGKPKFWQMLIGYSKETGTSLACWQQECSQELLAYGLPLLGSALFCRQTAWCYHEQQSRRLQEFQHRPHPSGEPVKVFTDWIEAFKEEVYTILRGCYLTTLFLPVVVLSPLCVWLGWGWHMWVDLIQWTLTMAGPAFIKWGQVIHH